MTSHPPHEVNKLCATCTQECKQAAYVKVLECAKYVRIPKVTKGEEGPKA